MRQMSEFKFACPVCGQHITADSSASGTPLECPTCFQRIIAPQAPLSGDPKLILSGSKASHNRTPGAIESGLESGAERRPNLKASLVPVLLLAATGSVALLLWHNQLASLANGLAERASPLPPSPAPVVFRSPHPIPTTVNWTLNLTNATIPAGAVVGNIHGNGFLCERVTFKSGRISFRQGLPSLPDLGLTVSLGVRQAEQLTGKVVLVTPSNPVPAPRVALRWKDDQQEPVTEHIHAGYAMKILFGTITDGRIHGRIFIALPDEQKSFAAGNFEAEILKPSQPLAGQ